MRQNLLGCLCNGSNKIADGKTLKDTSGSMEDMQKSTRRPDQTVHDLKIVSDSSRKTCKTIAYWAKESAQLHEASHKRGIHESFCSAVHLENDDSRCQLLAVATSIHASEEQNTRPYENVKRQQMDHKAEKRLWAVSLSSIQASFLKTIPARDVKKLKPKSEVRTQRNIHRARCVSVSNGSSKDT